VAGVHQFGVFGAALEFAQEGFHGLAFARQLVLFVHQFEEGLHVFHVEGAEFPGLGEAVRVHGVGGEEGFIVSAGFGAVPIGGGDLGELDQDAELVPIAVVDAGEIAHQGVRAASEEAGVFLAVEQVAPFDRLLGEREALLAGDPPPAAEPARVEAGELVLEAFAGPGAEVDLLHFDVSDDIEEHALEEAGELVGVAGHVLVEPAFGGGGGDGEGGAAEPFGAFAVGEGEVDVVEDGGDGFAVAAVVVLLHVREPGGELVVDEEAGGVGREVADQFGEGGAVEDEGFLLEFVQGGVQQLLLVGAEGIAGIAEGGGFAAHAGWADHAAPDVRIDAGGIAHHVDPVAEVDGAEGQKGGEQKAGAGVGVGRGELEIAGKDLRQGEAVELRGGFAPEEGDQVVAHGFSFIL